MVPLGIAAVVLLVAAAAVLLTGLRRRSADDGAIPSPFHIWSDLVFEVTKTGDFPDAVKLHAAHGPVFWWRFLGRRMLMVGTYEAVKQVLHGEDTLVKADYPGSVKKMLGDFGMVNLSGKQHIRLKRLAQAAFTPKAIRGYLPRMQAIAEQAVQKWARDGDILVYDEMKWFTFKIAVELIVGFDDSWTSDKHFPAINEEFRVWLEGLFSFPVAIPGTAFARGMKMKEALMQRIHASLDLLEQRRAAAGGSLKAEEAGESAMVGPAGNQTSTDASAADQPTTLDYLMNSVDEEGRGMNREQIADTVLTLLFAGHDTSATSLTRIFHHLHNHPEAVERLRQEQVGVLAKHGPVITEAALQDMPYTEGVVREALRITPIINGFPRVALQDFDLCGYHIPKGTRMQCSLVQPLKTDARWQDEADPLAFKPERWLGGAAQKQGAWIPFGGGLRLCLGWLLAMVEMKMLLATIFRSHTVELRQPEEPWLFFPLARPKHGMPARFVAVTASEE